MKRAYLICSVVVALGAGGLGALNLLPTSDAHAVTEAASQNALKTQTFNIEKMTCTACPITVNKAMSKVSGVSSVDVDFQAKTARVKFDPKRTDAYAIASASANAGYPASPQTRRPDL
ncbi:cation transporter [uncultured Parasphingorhabdus sp.]|uniref:heavy-metal-associated domain-containing protein n=1 Tax=uncultured Parasphingorhabdus sp. TaxID=2709694 RepID=UPI0030DD6A49|tara:strand:+ start:39482 stop:39835 length:354 start_codon:yes stop_codon:yes gene_type:complete